MLKILRKYSFLFILFAFAVIFMGLLPVSQVVRGESINGATHGPLDNFQGHPPIHINRNSTSLVVGLSPKQIDQVYNLPGSGGTGTIAIIDAYDDANVQKDLAT